MILDPIDRFDAYRPLSPLLGQALDWLRAHPDQPDGRYTIDGERLFAMVQTYTTEPSERRRWEAHRRYVDLQVVTRGVELVGHAPTDSLACTDAYDGEKDAAFFTPPPAGEAGLLRLGSGFGLLLEPHDAHQPGVQAGGPQAVRKVVFKLEAGSFRR